MSATTATTARTLLWAAAILGAVGAMIGSPAGGLLVLGLGALVAGLAAIPGTRRARIAAALLALTCLALGAARLGDARREMASYRAGAARASR